MTCKGTVLRLILRMKVVLGVYGDSLADSVFLRPSGHSTVMEFFPSGVFTREAEMSVRSLGIHYIAWWNHQYVPPFYISCSRMLHLFCRQFEGDSLPPVVSGGNHPQKPLIDATAVIQAIQKVVTRT